MQHIKKPSRFPLRRLFKIAFTAAVLATALYLYSIHTVHYSGTEQVRVDIQNGASMSQIAQILKEKSLINSTTFFKIHARLSNSERTVKAGRYQIEPDMTPAGILEFLAHPTNGEISVTIPEGYTIFEIDEKLNKQGLITAGIFIEAAKKPSAEIRTQYTFLPKDATLEGYLFPDTYLVFAQGFTPNELIQKMLNNFKKRVIDSGVFTTENLADSITMASILEKEIRNTEDMPIAAGLLLKRVKEGWPLQVDASILYQRELDENSADVSRALTRSDFATNSPYNTYAHLGLPPGPIGNPGINTIKAVAAPEESDFWFYITDAQGKAHFARTNTEHEKNKDFFLR